MRHVIFVESNAVEGKEGEVNQYLEEASLQSIAESHGVVIDRKLRADGLFVFLHP